MSVAATPMKSAAKGIMPETGERFILVDPLDGTKEFLNRNGEFTVNIALVEIGVPVLGIVHLPALDETRLIQPGISWVRRP